MQIEQRSYFQEVVQSKFTLLKNDHKILEKVKISDLYLLESAGNYCYFHTLKKRYIYRIPLKNINQIAAFNDFVQINRNQVINIQHLSIIDTKTNTVIIANIRFKISPKYKQNLMNSFVKLTG